MFAFRSSAFVLAVAVGLALACGTALADEATIDNCKVAKVEGTKLTFETPKGVKYTGEVAGDAKITLDGKAAKLSDLKEGTKLVLTAKKESGAITILKVDGSTK
ncbi:MAG: hypothetical protein C0467_19340 [Planctomycetaceae bacterium]|nr:hypothetical protein [Planctomycetaceae bacterium]